MTHSDAPTGGTPRRVLVVEDDVVVRRLLSKVLTDEGYQTVEAASGEEALTELGKHLFDAVLLDLNLPGIQGMDVLAVGPTVQTDTPFIVMTAFGSVDTAVEAMKNGAFDYVSKPFRTDELLLTLRRAHEEMTLRREVARLRRQVREGPGVQMVGKSAGIERVRDLIARVAPSRATVLITGDTGTGKELVARSIHALSGRTEHPFVAVNCAAIPETLLESELFGHMKGAFTGAITSKRGLLEEASGGTLFLDEVGAISANIQVKLLRALQERTILRVGGREPVPIDIRLIAATNLDLGEEVRAGRFREDLYYRLSVFPIRVPSLRERRDDIPILAAYFLRRTAAEHQVDAPAIPPATMQRLIDYDWPGNVRELENFVERSVIMHAGAKTIPFDPSEGLHRRQEHDLLKLARAERWNLERVEREYILAVLEEVGGHQGRAAEILGIDRRTLYRKLKLYRGETDPGLESPDASEVETA
ncbi:MAG: sigma-54-dependent Fis family transcriptional regulator [Gemmatimonadetes bacterium]|nr:sigma-54-dependent Fis family transcriptional regulator [Gemmatimonadota bacterium]